MRDLIQWKNQVVQYPGRFRLDPVAGEDRVYDLVPQPGDIIQEGTPIDADGLNEMDQKAFEALQAAKFNANHLRSANDHIDALEGEVIRVELTNSQSYPFNNSQKSVTLSKRRNKTNYMVLVEVISSHGGGVGDIRITDRVDNMFKLSYSGAAASVTVDCYVMGGY